MEVTALSSGNGVTDCWGGELSSRNGVKWNIVREGSKHLEWHEAMVSQSGGNIFLKNALHVMGETAERCKKTMKPQIKTPKPLQTV